MLHVSIATSLADRFASLLVAKPNQWLGGERWFAHLVTIGDSEMTLVLEPKTRYCLVFHNLTEQDYRQFPELLTQRICYEVSDLCQLYNHKSQLMSELIRSETLPMQFGIGLDYSVSDDIYEVSRHLQSIVEELGGYPVKGISETDLGAKINQIPLHGTDLALTPLRLFADYWQQRMLLSDQHAKQPSNPDNWPDNIVPLPCLVDKTDGVC